MATQLFWHPILGDVYIDMLTCMMSFMDLGINPLVEEHLVPAPQEHFNSD